MRHLEQILLTGLTTGSIYSLSALGFSIVYNAPRVTNFANGEFVMMGGLLSASFSVVAGFGVLPSVLLSCAIVAGVGSAGGLAGNPACAPEGGALLCDDHHRVWYCLSRADDDAGWPRPAISPGIWVAARPPLWRRVRGKPEYLDRRCAGRGQRCAVISVPAHPYRQGDAGGQSATRALRCFCGINPRHMAMLAFGLAGPAGGERRGDDRADCGGVL